MRRVPQGLALGSLVGLVGKDLDLAALTPYDGSRETVVVLVALAVATVWALGLRRMVVALAAGTALLWLLVAFTPLSATLADGLVLDEVVEPGDAVFVSAAALPPGEAGRAEGRSRLLRGVELAARGKAPLLVVPEGNPATEETVTEIMQMLGVGKGRLMVLSTVPNTRQEVLALARLYEEQGWTQLIVVTSPLHSSRLAACLSRENVRALLAPSRETRFDLRNLDRASDRIAAFGSVIHERLGRFVYGLRGWS